MSAYQATGDKSEYEVALGLLLRAERERQGLSLAGVEEKSGGRWKAVVVGTWERAERSITVAKLADLAAFYGVPVSSLLPACGDEASRGAGARGEARRGARDGRRRPAAERGVSAADCTRVYLAFSEMAHLLEPGVQATAGRPPSLCRRAPQRYSAWLGTGSQAERERAAELPLCRKCGQKAAEDGSGLGVVGRRRDLAGGAGLADDLPDVVGAVGEADSGGDRVPGASRLGGGLDDGGLEVGGGVDVRLRRCGELRLRLVCQLVLHVVHDLTALPSLRGVGLYCKAAR